MSELDAEAEELIEAMTRPKRRARPRLAAPLREAEERDVETPFGPVRAWRLGKGRAVLLIHGWDDDNCLWGPLIEKFHAIGRAVVALDLPGHGFSKAEDPSANAATAAVHAVAAALGPIDAIVGHSFGCTVGIRAMVEGLAVTHAAFIAVPLPNPARRWDRARRADTPEDIIARAAELYAARSDAAEPPFDIAGAASHMTAAALFLHSMDDEQCSVGNAETLKALWPGAKLALADGLGHRLIAQDAAMLDRLVNFIEDGR
jgi:pimeloyl-ACP methyl ester carboxylesterase